MKRRILLLTLITAIILSFGAINIFAETSNAENEPLQFFDFSLEEGILSPDNTRNYYSWSNEGMLLRPTGTNEGKMVFSYNEEHKALQIDFNDTMVSNGSCLWFSLSEAYEVSENKSYYLVFKYKYNGTATSGFLSANQMLAGYSSVNNWSVSNSGGRVLKSLTAAGMPTITDGEWLLTFVRVSWIDKMTSIEYDADKTNIKVIRTSLIDTMSNDSVLLKSVALFEDNGGLATKASINENDVKTLRTTAPVSFSMNKTFASADKVSYFLDDENVKSVAFYQKDNGEWKAIEGTPGADGTYRIEVVLNDGYYFESSWLSTSEDVDKGVLVYEFTVGEVVKETEVPSNTDEDPKTTAKPGSTSEDKDEVEKSSNGLIIGVIIAAVVVVTVVIAVIVRKKQGK